ncbi:MBL fold metallo-hydrolase [Actinomadura sp. ATCC 31491]|uniref:MBL fold metallo-hydrolase n=1 Tax=Actinomadura luzonensis TaxID=2805427 RepID=A0ABT0G1E2_9ACTN|nr:MBL fold metallo-hydrolase [Actinomadura luzonensis]MCK2218432.1 MBL fold metallo-hydrolase [Actinomadura luzonensis]
MLKQVAEGVLVHESGFVQSNAVVVQGPAGVLLIDPGVTESELGCLADDLRELGRPVVAGFSRPDAAAKARIAEHLRETEIAGQVPLDLLGLITGLPAGTTHIPWDGLRVRIIEHQAHAPGHAALLIEERGVLVAGDLVSDVLVPMLDLDAATDPIEDYLAALRLIEDVAGGVGTVVPGHGSVGGPGALRARIDLDRAYVLALRDGRAPDDPRVGPSARPGWEWVRHVHEGQLQRLAR